jgi:hypothetical protein
MSAPKSFERALKSPALKMNNQALWCGIPHPTIEPGSTIKRPMRERFQSPPCGQWLESPMVYVFAIVGGLIGALGGGAIGFLAAAATGVSSEGFVPFVVTVPMAAMGFIAAAALTIMFKADVRSPREIAIRTAAVVLMTAVIAVGGFNLRTIAFGHLGLLSKVPAAEFEIGLSFPTTPMS